jgi:hypothetical protein
MTMSHMIQEGYVIENVAGRKVLARYFQEYDQTFLCPTNPIRGRWNTGASYETWLHSLDAKFSHRLVAASPNRVAIQGQVFSVFN